MFFWNSLAFSMIQWMLNNLISGSSAFSKTSLNIWKFTVHVLLKPGLENFEHYFNWHVRWVQLCGRLQGKFGLGVQNEVGQRLIEFCQENALVIPNTLFQQHKRRLYTWISPDGQYWNQIDYILCSQRWRSSIQSAKTRPGADCGSDHELLIAKFRLKLKRVGKTPRTFRYDLNHIPYDYTVGMTKHSWFYPDCNL